MSRILSQPAVCDRCHQTIPAGTRARGAGPFRHYDACPPVVRTDAGAATARQVAYAISLQQAYWTPAVFGGRRYDQAALAAMSRDEISRVIDALLDERGLQGGY